MTPFSANGLITLTTDFGLSDPYVGVMKGVILARHPAARLVDLTHQVPAYQPGLAGFWLTRVWRYFPAGTVHLAIVDPGVGTARAMALLEMAGQVFVAPDNGLLDALLRETPQAQMRRFEIQDLARLQLSVPSRTFHGRDIFAPLVAEIAAGRQSPTGLGRAPERRVVSAPASGRGQIVCADHYGNLLTDIPADGLSSLQNPCLRFREQHLQIRPSYGFAAPGELLGVVNSWGTLEIAQCQGNAQQSLQAIPGEAVWLVESVKSG